MKLDQEFLNIVEPAIFTTWDQIAPDALESMGEQDNECAIEMCIDADRLFLNGGNQLAHSICRAACHEHGYITVLQFLAKNISLT